MVRTTTTQATAGRPRRHRHRWDFLTSIWTASGQRANPCVSCPELFVYGTVRIQEAKP